MNLNLKDKQILFISPKFFDYETKIKRKMEQMGSCVDYFDERPSNSSFTKAMLRINSHWLAKLTNKHYNNILNEIKDKRYDYIFIIKGESITCEILQTLKNKFKNAKMILYLWDSIKNVNTIDKKFAYFDKVFTFDLNDVMKSKSLNFRPLFYIDEYDFHDVASNYEYDCCFIGTIHSDRYKLIKKIKSELEANGLRTYFYMYFPAKELYYYYKLTNRNFKDASLQDFYFKPLSPNEIKEIILSSKAVLDIQHPNQNGLTMRTIEMLGMKKKLITTNKSIKLYDFFDENNIFLLDRNNPIINPEFIKNKYKMLDKSIYQRYSLNNWVREVFS